MGEMLPHPRSCCGLASHAQFSNCQADFPIVVRQTNALPGLANLQPAPQTTSDGRNSVLRTCAPLAHERLSRIVGQFCAAEKHPRKGEGVFSSVPNFSRACRNRLLL
jgi:hypothetical protein